VEPVQIPSEFVREQVTTVRETVDRVAGSVAETVAAAPGVTARASQVGDYIREQRSAARVSLRELARAAGVSNPYLSQVERGLRKPSAEILASIARGLKISAETLYEQAGILDRRSGSADTVAAIRSDNALSERHKAVLLELYETYVREHAASTPTPESSRPTSGPQSVAQPSTKESA
jgi:transcriptional regulator with XRE-family HTH domain